LLRQIRYLSIVAGILAFATLGHAQTYQMVLTGVGTGVTADGVYVSPYQGEIVQGGNITGGTITGGTTVYTGYVICDDFTTDSFLNSPWTATASTAASGGKFNGSTFTFGGSTYNSQQMYNAVAYLANGLLGSLSSPTTQTNYSFAIWDIMDGQTTDPDGGAATLVKSAFEAVSGGYVGTNVDVFTASPQNASQEFLVVGGPAISTPEPVAAGVLGANLVTLMALVLFRRRRETKAA